MSPQAEGKDVPLDFWSMERSRVLVIPPTLPIYPPKFVSGTTGDSRKVEDTVSAIKLL